VSTTGKLMIVEDELLIAEHLRSSLASLGHEVVGIAANCEAALTLANAGPELALLDIRIQGNRDGIDVASLLRQCRDMAVLFITAHSDRDSIERAKQLEPSGYLVKPFTDRTLAVSVECALHRHRLEQRRRQHLNVLTVAVAGLREGVLFADESGIVQSANDAAERQLCGECGTGLKGRSLVDVLQLSSLLRERLIRWIGEASSDPFVGVLATPGMVLEVIHIASEGHRPIVLATLRPDSPWPLETRTQAWSGRRTANGEPLVTVCAMCRRAQENSDNYVPIDSYLALRFGLAFSHTLCPNCLGEMNGKNES
jgi:AmiR/NasT family two-component response regulator